MLKSLSKSIPYNYSFRNQLLIGSLLGLVVSFIMIFLQPFGTFDFESEHKNLIFFGFGVLIAILYLFWARIENVWYDKKDKNWLVKYELVSFILFMLMASLPIHLYNQIFLNDFLDNPTFGLEYVKHGLWFLRVSIVPIMLILFPFYYFLRNRMGDLVTVESSNEIEISGINKGEVITINKDDLLYVQAAENYVNFYYLQGGEVKYKTFRNTLSAISKQAPFLQKSHRSYLVNVGSIKDVKGNSQNAKIEFLAEGLHIPLSKSFYKNIKSALVDQPKN